MKFSVAPTKKLAVDDLCVGFLDECWDANDFAFPENARVLEVGCAEADTVAYLKERRPDLHVTAIDWRQVKRPKADKLVQGDVLRYNFPPDSFDCIVSVSTLEHIGLGAYGDPINAEGDRIAMNRIVSWLKVGGWVYFDVPYRPKGAYQVHGGYRAYNESQLQQRLLAHPSMESRAYRVFSVNHPDAPYISVVMQKVA